MNSELLRQAIEDAKAVKLLVLSWREGQFCGVMGWDDASKNTVKRVSCFCTFCQQSIPLETSASHAATCTKELPRSTSSFDAIFRAKLEEPYEM